jgi:predicted metal-dependent hydrolase
MIDLSFENLDIKIIQKKIKRLYLSVYPPHGQIRISAPQTMSRETIHAFVLSKFEWIKKQQEKILNRPPPTTKQFIDKELHDYLGQAYFLKLIETHHAPKVVLSETEIILHIRAGSNVQDRANLLEHWYRRQLQDKILTLIAHWEMKMAVKVKKVRVQKMKTKWGSCTPLRGSIRINLELIKKAPEYLEYVIVHELTHLIEASHNHRFKALMDTFMPDWRLRQKNLNH